MPEARQDEWDALENAVVNDFDDYEFLRDVGIREPSVTDIQITMAALKKELSCSVNILM
jgi:hypothetical protein